MWRPGSGIKTGSWNWTVAFCSAASCVSREGKQSCEFGNCVGIKKSKSAAEQNKTINTQQ